MFRLDNSVWKVVLCTVEGLVASLASSYQILLVPFPQSLEKKMPPHRCQIILEARLSSVKNYQLILKVTHEEQNVCFSFTSQFSRTSMVAQTVKCLAYNVGDLDSIPGLGRSPGEGHGSPLRYSCLENPQGAGSATVHEVAKSQTRLSD